VGIGEESFLCDASDSGCTCHTKDGQAPEYVVGHVYCATPVSKLWEKERDKATNPLKINKQGYSLQTRIQFYKAGYSFTKQDTVLQTRIQFYKAGYSFTNQDTV